MAFYLRRAVGIEITDNVIRFAVVGRKIRGMDVQGLHEHPLPEGVVVNGVIEHHKQLAAHFLQSVRETFKSERLPARSVFILPWQLFSYEEKIVSEYSADTLPTTSEARSALGLDEISHVWSAAVTESDNGRQYHALVAPRESVEEWRQLFRDVRAPHVTVDVGSVATLRAVYASAPHGGRILIRFFDTQAELTLVYDRMIVGTVMVPCDKSQVEHAVEQLHTFSQQLADVRDYAEAEKIVNDKIMPVIEEPMTGVIKAVQQLSDHLDMLFSRRPQEALIIGYSLPRVFTDTLQQRIGIWMRQAHTSVLARKDLRFVSASPEGVTNYISTIGAAERILFYQWNKDPRMALAGGTVYATHLLKQRRIIPGVPTFGHQLRVSSPQLFAFLGIMAVTGMVFLMRGVSSPAALIQGETWDPPELEDVVAKPLVTSDIVADEMPSEIIPSAPTTPRIYIKDTPTGWLNVRSGPSTVYDAARKVLPGESYEFIEEDGDWYKIRLSEGIEGWVIKEYTEKKP